jgi:xanthine dehydrogenase small subunit
MSTIRFILNDRTITTDEHHGTTALDFVRRSARLTGTKEGCREGDCGACTILLGECDQTQTEAQGMMRPAMRYTAVNSCLLPLGALQGKHIVTVEGLNHSQNPAKPETTPIQQAMADEGGTQCGFCTPGFIISMTGYTLTSDTITSEGLTQAIDGNVCRCTGYASIKRAVERVVSELDVPHSSTGFLQRLVEQRIIPQYFLTIPERLQTLTKEIIATNGVHTHSDDAITVSGGTDLFVQKHETLATSNVRILPPAPHHEAIWEEDGVCYMEATTTVAAFEQSLIIRRAVPKMPDFLRVFASTPIRNRATLGGNINNASPIGDLTAILLALGADLTLRSASGNERTIPLRTYYTGYKTLDRLPDEIVTMITFRMPDADLLDEQWFFNYEKVSRRTYLDIASVNSAVLMRVSSGIILEANVSAGGVAPVPLYCAKTSAYLVGKPISSEIFREAAEILVAEAAPISDARGTVEYKRLLLQRLFFAHALALFPEAVSPHEILAVG